MRKLLIASILLLSSSLAFSQEAARDRVFVFSDFSGGIATKLSDNSTPPKYARIAENMRVNSNLKAITKKDKIYTYGTADATEQITGMHRLYTSSASKSLIVTHGDEIEVGNDTTGAFTAILALTTGDYRWTWLTWHDLAIGGDGYNQPVKYNGTTATYLGTCAGVDSGAGAGPAAGTYTYKVAFYTATYTVLFNVPSAPVVNGVGDHDISLTMIPIGPDSYLGEAITGRKVYRSTIAAPGTWQLLTNGTIANNTATTLTDSDLDAALGAAYPAGTATWTPPKGRLHIVHKNRLWIANNPTYPSRIYYSKEGSHDLFETALDYFDIRQNDGDEITFTETLLGTLTVGKTNSIQKIFTDGDDSYQDWSISDPFSNIGCDAMYSAVNTPLGIMYLSKAKSGIYTFNGQASVLKSELATPVINDILPSNLSNVAGEYNNNMYFMSYASSAVSGSTNNRVLIYDMLSDAYTIDILNINSFCSFTGGSDGGILYSGASDSGKIYQFSNVAQEIAHSKHADFTGTFDDARYIPTDVGGDSNSPIIELSWDLIIDNMVGTINAQTGDVDRPDTGGTYISPVLNTIAAASYDKIYWNETLAAGTDATLAIRHGATSAGCAAAAWSSEYSVSAGSDISGITITGTDGEYTQYRITLSTGDIDVTPYVVTNSGYTVKLVYNRVGTAAETSIALHWQSGWLDFGVPGYKKTLRKIYTAHEGTSGTLTMTLTNEYGDTDTFNIDMSVYPEYYEEYFTSGALIGKKFKLDITNSDLNTVQVKEVVLVYDVEPLV
jgi:hypothetical protein